MANEFTDQQIQDAMEDMELERRGLVKVWDLPLKL